ncbi:MAG TPA: carboxypeptidase regulatory-like domain-containing protein [Pyrinomonadaceae bacterium]|jgi:hypothetical protein
MRQNMLTKALATAAFLALAFFVWHTRAAAQTPPPPAPTGKLVGKIFEQGTNRPLPAEVGVTVAGARRMLLQHAAASPQGEFVLDGLEAGKLHVVTKLDGYAAEHQNVSLAAGETKYVEFFLSKVKLVRGTVRGPGGKPVIGANVKVIYATPAPARGEVRTTYQWESGETLSDKAGNYVVGVHPDADFVVEASHPGLSVALSAPKRIKANDKEAAVHLLLDSGVNVAGEVKDEAGHAVPGAQVRLIEVGGRRAVPGFVSPELLQQQARFTASGADGAFSFDEVAPSKKMLVVVHPGYKPYKQLVDLSARAPLRVVLSAKQ